MSDSRAAGWAPSNIEGWPVRSVVRRGASLAVLATEVEKNLQSNTGLVVMVALHCDLTYLTSYSPTLSKGLMRLKFEAPLADLYNVITSRDREWKVIHKVCVVWAIPYVPNFLFFNRRRSRMLGLGPLCRMYEEEARWSEQQMRVDLAKLVGMLQPKGILMINLDDFVTELTAATGSDGVHLGRDVQNRVLTSLITQAISMVPLMIFPEPIRPLSDRARVARRHRRRRQRLMRRPARLLQPLDAGPALLVPDELTDVNSAEPLSLPATVFSSECCDTDVV